MKLPENLKCLNPTKNYFGINIALWKGVVNSFLRGSGDGRGDC